MTIKNIEKNGNQATIVVEIDKELMESGVNKAYNGLGFCWLLFPYSC